MKITFTASLFVWAALLYPFINYSQDILWEKSYGGIHAEYLFDG